MNNLRKEWTEDEKRKLAHDINVAKINVFVKWGFDVSEISRILSIPESVVKTIINK